MWIYVAFMFFVYSSRYVFTKDFYQVVFELNSVFSCAFLHPYLIFNFPLIV